MTANIAKLVYFEKWMNGHAVDILDRSNVMDLDSAYLAYPAFVERLINPEAWASYQERFEQRLGFRPDDLTKR